MENDNIKLNDTEVEQVAGGANSKYVYYKVKAGDTLTKIAHHYHTTIDTIMSLNPIIHDRNLIRVGWELKIPR